MPDKLCPMRKRSQAVWHENTHYGRVEDGIEEDFLPCLGEECAIWNEECPFKTIPNIADALEIISDILTDFTNKGRS